ncbi:MAG: ABC transporter ATP-binding protein, partial [Deltaproteobacteria bacterium]|nr:ABC transporter ATP-binding protein [Deltaproteobacteria bacterium]
MLEISHLNVFYDKVHVLKDLSLHLGETECVTLIGANGAGKSTLINTICGLVPSASGQIRLNGEEIGRIPAYQIVRLGISQAPEGRQIFANLTVMDNLRLGAYTRYSSKTKAEVAADIEQVFDMFPRLNERSDQLAGTMSGGEQQMLAMGRALMSNCRFILLDEPSMGLAPLLMQELFRAMRKLNEHGMTILLVEQNARVALRFAHRGYVLDTGSIVAEGPSD